MSALLHVSDTHFGTERAPVVRALLALEHSLQVGVVVLSGDVTQRARSSQFRQAAAFLAELQAPRRLYLPGNHDIPLFNLVARVLYPYRGYRRAVCTELDPVCIDSSWTILGVNTTRPGRHVNGEVSSRQCRRIVSDLQRADPGTVRLVVTHQPVQVFKAEDVEDRLIGAKQAVPAWVEAGADLLLGGHIHRPYVAPVASTRVARRRAWVVQAGTALSHRTRAGISNSVNVIRLEKGCSPRLCVVERWDFHEASERFEPVERTECPLSNP